MFNQNPTNHALPWFIVQINGLREQVLTVNFSDVEFLRKVNFLLGEILQIDAGVYLPTYQTIDLNAATQILDQIKKETINVRLLIRRVALETTMQPKERNLVDHISILLQSISISFSQLDKELKSEYYLPLFTYSSSDGEENT